MSLFSQDFADIRYQPGYVDKSLLIKKILNTTEGILLIVPRRFGKSVNLSMIKRFFEILPEEKAVHANRKLIEKYETIMREHFKNHPIIFLDLKSPGNILFRIKTPLV